MTGIVWLASYPKSGNTWLRAFIANLMADGEAPVLLDKLRDFATYEASSQWYAPHLGGRIREEDMERARKLRPKVQREISHSVPKGVHILVKTHSCLGSLHGVQQINLDETAGAIYVVRDPLDVAISFAHHFGMSVDDAITSMAQPTHHTGMAPDHVFEWHSDWSTHVQSWTEDSHPRLLVLRYEDLLEDPLPGFGRVAEHVKLASDSERIAKAVRFSGFQTLQEMERKDGFLEKSSHADSFFRKGQAGQWRELLTSNQVRRMVARHRAQMERFGYLPEEA